MEASLRLSDTVLSDHLDPQFWAGVGLLQLDN